MRPDTLTLVLIQVALTGGAVVMSAWVKFPWLAAVAMGLLGASATAATLTPQLRKSSVWRWGTVAAWICTLVVPGSLMLVPDTGFTVQSFWDQYYAALAWLIAAAILPASHRLAEPGQKTPWRLLVMVWAFFGDFLCLGTAYSQNQIAPFYFGLLMGFVLLLLCKLWFRLPVLLVQVVNTLILLTLGLPLVDLAVHPHRTESMAPQRLKKYYCYRMAKENLAAFERWWNWFGSEYGELEQKLLIKNQDAPVTIRLRPGAQGTLIESHISINSRGFRGREIADPKGQTYRIVALGESTTFGYTINPEDKPWPELLEQLINQELKPARPVEVINAGIPGITLPENLNRFPYDILPLKPDMIICYHGINGFQLLDKAMPPLRGKPPPVYRKRPLPLLADCEYRLKLLAYQHTRGARGSSRPPTFSNLLDTEYARAYCSLIDIARTNNIRLVLANFPLAVNQQSPPELVEFFSRRHKRTDWYIRANAAHGMMVEELARAHSEVSFVNTRPHLDGEEEKYIDLMHLTQEGDRQLAWTFFDGIRDMLETELKGSATIPTAPGDSNAATQPAR